MGEQMQKRKNTWKRVPLREIRDLLREQGLDEPASTSKDAKTPMGPAPVKQPTVRAGGGLSPVVSRGFKNNRLWIDKRIAAQALRPGAANPYGSCSQRA